MLQNHGNDPEIGIREARIALPTCHLRIDAPCAEILLRRPGFAHPVQRFCAASKIKNGEREERGKERKEGRQEQGRGDERKGRAGRGRTRSEEERRTRRRSERGAETGPERRKRGKRRRKKVSG